MERIKPGTIIALKAEGLNNVLAVYIKQRGPTTHMVCLGPDRLFAVTTDEIKLRPVIKNEATVRVELLKAAEPFLKEGYRFTGY